MKLSETAEMVLVVGVMTALGWGGLWCFMTLAHRDVEATEKPLREACARRGGVYLSREGACVAGPVTP